MQEIKNESDLETLTLLGKDAQPSRKLEVFPNHNPERDYTVTLRTDEFTCLCPLTGQPDFAKITITYIPDKSILESKSLKLYFWSFRNDGAFHEHVTNTILDDLVKATEPRWCKVSAEFAVRGGIAITVDAEYKKAVAPAARPLPPPEDAGEKRTSRYEQQQAFGDSNRSRTARWDTERERSRPSERDTRRPTEEKRWPAKREYRTDREKSRPPAPGEYHVDAPPKRSERKTTKTLGVTRTWRKRT